MATDWQILGPTSFGQDIDETDAGETRAGTLYPLIPLGTIVQAVDKGTTQYGVGEFIYLKGVASTVATDLVAYDLLGHQTTRAAANQIGPLALAQAAVTALLFGWYQIGGVGVVTGTASDATDKVAYLHATAGRISDAVVAGDRIDGMTTVTALDTPASGQITVMLQRPTVTDASN